MLSSSKAHPQKSASSEKPPHFIGRIGFYTRETIQKHKKDKGTNDNSECFHTVYNKQDVI